MKSIKSIILLLSLGAILVGCTNEKDIFTREQDSLTLSCVEQTLAQNILCLGEWTTYSDSEWLTVTPEKGTGNGKDYQFYYLSAEYNSGAERTATVAIFHNGNEYHVTVTQNACDFRIGDPLLDGSLVKGIQSDVVIKIPYYKASGTESVTITASISGAASNGLSIQSTVFNSFSKGDGFIELPVVGTPATTGNVAFKIKVGSNPEFTLNATVSEQASGNPEGFPVRWNFWDAGITAPASVDAGKDWANDPHKIYSSHGDNPSAFLSPDAATAGVSYGFNKQSIMVTGYQGGDCIVATIPVKNVSSATKITVEGATGGAKGSIGFWVLEYSSDAVAWTTVEGLVGVDRAGTTVYAHFWNTYASINSNGTECKDGSIGNRGSYDKNGVYETYHKYTFNLKGVNIADGNLYLRLRALEWGATQDKLVKAGSGNTDIKGFEVSLATNE